MSPSAADRHGSRWRRHLAAALLLVFALPSCITAMMWSDGNASTTLTPVACDAALLLAASDSSLLRVALRVPAAELPRLGKAPVEAAYAWVVLAPEDAAQLADLLARARRQPPREVSFWVDFSVPGIDGGRAVWLHMAATFAAGTEAGVQDARPSHSESQRVVVECACQWQVVAVPPGTGSELVPPYIRTADGHTQWVNVVGKALATPLTVAADIVLLPVEALFILLMPPLH